jgi:hypothetical protein
MKSKIIKVITVVFALSLFIAFLLLQSGFFDKTSSNGNFDKNDTVKIHTLDTVKKPIVLNDSMKRMLLSTSKTFVISDEKLFDKIADSVKLKKD